MPDDFSSKDFDALLDEFINKQLNETDDILADFQEDEEESAETKPSLTPDDEASFEEDNDENYDTDISEEDSVSKEDSAPEYEEDTELSKIFADLESDASYQLAEEEKRLYNAYCEFIKSVVNCAKEHQAEIPEFLFSAEDLLPRFSPNRTENLKEDIAACWDVLLQNESAKLAKLPYDASDEQILDFAEKISAPNLQLSLISYVETLIETDACETAYNIRKVKYQKHKIEKELYEQHQRTLEKKRLYAQAVRERNFPIDADLLINNFFKTASKDPQGAFEILTKNPATYAPIQIDKIPNRLFGLIKAGPEDGKAVNKKLGKFLAGIKA